MTLTFRELSRVNRERCEAPDGFDHPVEGWSLSDWMLAATGEFGEAANVAKKLRRLDLALPNKEAGLTRSDAEPLKEKLAEECADTIIYALLLMSLMGVNASSVIERVFDRKSVEYGFPERARG